jgi:GTPase KRas protein
MIIVATMCDSEEREVSPSEGLALANKYNCPFMESSAKLNKGIIDLFDEIILQMEHVNLHLREWEECKSFA